MPYLIIIIIVAIGLIFTFIRGNQTSTVTPETPAIVETATSTTAGVSYRDGPHETKVTYQTPERDTYLLDVTLTLANDVVTNAAIVYGQGAEKDPNAQRFEQAYRTTVVGKKLDEINLSRVGGASLTTQAFNDAVAKIKLEARS